MSTSIISRNWPILNGWSFVHNEGRSLQIIICDWISKQIGQNGENWCLCFRRFWRLSFHELELQTWNCGITISLGRPTVCATFCLLLWSARSDLEMGSEKNLPCFSRETHETLISRPTEFYLLYTKLKIGMSLRDIAKKCHDSLNGRLIAQLLNF